MRVSTVSQVNDVGKNNADLTKVSKRNLKKNYLQFKSITPHGEEKSFMTSDTNIRYKYEKNKNTKISNV